MSSNKRDREENEVEDEPISKMCSIEYEKKVGQSKDENTVNESNKDNENDNGKDAENDGRNVNNVTIEESPVMSNREINQLKTREEDIFKLQDTDLYKDKLMVSLYWVSEKILVINKRLKQIELDKFIT